MFKSWESFLLLHLTILLMCNFCLYTIWECEIVFLHPCWWWSKSPCFFFNLLWKMSWFGENGLFFTFSVSSSRALTSWIILCISCDGMAEMTEWAQAEVTAASSWAPPSPRSMVHSLSVAKLCLKRGKMRMWRHHTRTRLSISVSHTN